jgi:mRNA interferase RelE/StbE
MKRYAVTLARAAQRDLDRLPANVRERLLGALMGLEINPRPPGTIKLAGSGDEYRIRVGDYRAVYVINDAESGVEVLRCQHRREVYR